MMYTCMYVCISGWIKNNITPCQTLIHQKGKRIPVSAGQGNAGQETLRRAEEQARRGIS